MGQGLPLREKIIREAGKYRTNTGSVELHEAFLEIESYLEPIWDVPPTLEAVSDLVRGISEGMAPPAAPYRREQALLAIPLCNYFRLLSEDDPDFDRAFPWTVARLNWIADALLPMDADILWVGIRNSMAWESSNRASTGGKPFDWTSILKHITRTRMMAVFHKIRATYDA